MRNEAVTTNPTQVTQATDAPLYNRPRRMESTEQPQYRDMNPAGTGRPDASPGQGQVTREGGRWRNTADTAPQNGEVTQPQAAPQPEGRQRGGFFQNVFSQPSGGQASEQPQQRQRAYEQPQRTYEQPQQQQRTYEQPQQRTYEQPQRSYSQPSYSAPSYGGGGGGGGEGGGGHSRGPR